MELGIVGLGRMGTALGVALVDAGATVHGFDLAASARDGARELGLTVHADLAALGARCDVVVTSLPTEAAVRSVVSGLGEVLRPGSLVVETSTCGPALARACAGELEQRGVRFVDCPVSGKAPELAILVGGEPGVLGPAEQFLALAASSLVHLGTLGAGYRVKLLQQYVKYARFLVAAEVLTFAEHVGLDLPGTVAALSVSTGAQPGLAGAEEHFLRDDAVARRAPASTISKDVELTRAMFREAGFASPSFEALARLFLAPEVEAMRDRPYPEVVDLLPAIRFPEES